MRVIQYWIYNKIDFDNFNTCAAAGENAACKGDYRQLLTVLGLTKFALFVQKGVSEDGLGSLPSLTSYLSE